MGHGVIAQAVTALTYGADNIRAPAHEIANEEKRCMRVMASKQVKQLQRVWLIGAIVESKRHFLPIGAGNQRAAEEQVSGRMADLLVPLLQPHRLFDHDGFAR
jgi:hypothetical protein